MTTRYGDGSLRSPLGVVTRYAFATRRLKLLITLKEAPFRLTQPGAARTDHWQCLYFLGKPRQLRHHVLRHASLTQLLYKLFIHH